MNDFSPSYVDSARLERMKVMQVSYSADDALNAVFYKRKILHTFKTKEKGHPVYEERDYIRMSVPNNGSRPLTEPDREVIPSDRQRFPREWALYEADENAVGFGHRIRDCVAFDREECETLENARIKTVEQLAAVSDNIVGAIFNGREMQERARKWLSNLKFVEQASQTDSEMQQLRAQNEALSEKLEKLMSMMTAQPQSAVPPSPRRGRPPRQETSTQPEENPTDA